MHSLLRLAGTTVAVSAAIGITPVPARADASGFGVTDGESVQAGAIQTGTRSVPPARTRSPGPRCTYGRLDGNAAAIADTLAREGAWPVPRGDGPGTWRIRVCKDNASQRWSSGLYWSPTRVDAERAAESAMQRTPIPPPVVAMSPAADRLQVVNLPTWFWVDPGQWRPVTARASVGALAVTATADPELVEWDMGNGDTLTCAGPGAPYDPTGPGSSDCQYAFPRSSGRASDGRFTVSATVVWRVSWSAGDGSGGDLGTVRRTTSFPVAVAEIQALNNRGEL